MRLEALAACDDARRTAAEALAGERFDDARSRLTEARPVCVGAALAEVERTAAEIEANVQPRLEARVLLAPQRRLRLR